MTVVLRGLAEGVVGASTVEVESIEGLFKTYPELNNMKHKLHIKEDRITGFAACDG